MVVVTSTVAASPEIEPRRWTRDEYHRMAVAGVFGPDERLELIEGVVYRMSPQTSWHASAIQSVQEALRSILPAGCHLRCQLPLVLGALSEPEPDLAVVAGAWQDYREAHPTAALLVVEVAHSARPQDLDLKRALYAHSRIPELWVLHHAHPRLEVFREPQGEVYRVHLTLGPGDAVTPLCAPAASLRVADLLP